MGRLWCGDMITETDGTLRLGTASLRAVTLPMESLTVIISQAIYLTKSAFENVYSKFI